MTDDALDPTLAELVDAARAMLEYVGPACPYPACPACVCKIVRRLAAALAPYADEVTE